MREVFVRVQNLPRGIFCVLSYGQLPPSKHHLKPIRNATEKYNNDKKSLRLKAVLPWNRNFFTLSKLLYKTFPFFLCIKLQWRDIQPKMYVAYIDNVFAPKGKYWHAQVQRNQNSNINNSVLCGQWKKLESISIFKGLAISYIVKLQVSNGLSANHDVGVTNNHENRRRNLELDLTLSYA